MSRFMKLKCNECGNEQVSFSHATKEVVCLGCGALLLEPMGGKANLLNGEIVEEYD
ncbi:MAG: 30S ribosomal protein S27e [Methanobacteriota archaeon]|nr:MAG: 30S ribosomal protein S27e [Euryarchaeota archaeon]